MDRTRCGTGVPDLAVYRGDQASERGAEGAELVVEIRSPGDESLAKLPWYLDGGCREVLIVDRDSLVAVLHGSQGPVEPARSEVLGARSPRSTGRRCEWSGPMDRTWSSCADGGQVV